MSKFSLDPSKIVTIKFFIAKSENKLINEKQKYQIELNFFNLQVTMKISMEKSQINYYFFILNNPKLYRSNQNTTLKITLACT